MYCGLFEIFVTNKNPTQTEDIWMKQGVSWFVFVMQHKLSLWQNDFNYTVMNSILAIIMRKCLLKL